MRIEDYRRQAEECRSLARNIPGGHYREQLLNMAVTWEALAIERERQVNLNASVDAHSAKAT